jgi:two-component system chemotaxis response regulator CheB
MPGDLGHLFEEAPQCRDRTRRAAQPDDGQLAAAFGDCLLVTPMRASCSSLSGTLVVIVLLERLLSSQVATGKPEMTESQRQMSHEQALSEGTGDYFEHLRAIGDPSPLTCPECHGGLWHVRDTSPRRYRCHTGHGFTARTLNLASEEASDNALWSTLRALHERAAVLGQLAAASRSEGRADEAAEFDRTAETVLRQAQELRELLKQPVGAA